MIKAVIFDLDGVILESADIKTKAFRKLFEDYPEKVDVVVDYHIKNMGVSRYIKFRHIYNNILGMKLSVAQEEKLAKKFSDIALEEIFKAPFVPGALEFLKTNHNNFNLFVASGTPEEELIFIVKKRCIFDYFQEVHGSPKLKADIVRNILKKKEFFPKDVVFVGDAETDMQAAKETGVNFIARVSPHSGNVSESKFRLFDLRGLSDSIMSINRIYRKSG